MDVRSPEQVAQMQTNYNQYVSQFLDSNGMLDPSEVGTQWHKQLDTDFMATDTSKVTAEQFRQIKDLNNAAYGQRESADMEKLLRKPIQTTTDLSDTTLETAKTDTGLLAQQVDALTADGTIDRGGKSIALRGSSRAAENFAVTGAAGAVADNSLSRANLELATSIAEAAKTNPDFAGSGPATIAQLAQELSPADRGFLLEQVRQTAGNDFAASTASCATA